MVRRDGAVEAERATRKTRKLLSCLCSPCGCMLEDGLVLIDSSWWRPTTEWSVPSCSFQGGKLAHCNTHTHTHACPSLTITVIVQLEFAKLSTPYRLFRRELVEQARSWPQKGGRLTHNTFGNLSAGCTAILRLCEHSRRSSVMFGRGRINSETVGKTVAAIVLLCIQFAAIRAVTLNAHFWL